MLPLCTSVTDLRLLSIAYWKALRISRSLPSLDTGLMPMAEVAGKRILVTFISLIRKSISFFTSRVPGAPLRHADVFALDLAGFFALVYFDTRAVGETVASEFTPEAPGEVPLGRDIDAC